MYKKLSVLIPVYNEEKTIKKCVERVLVAKILNMNLEVIISDNNSTDNTKEILKSIKDPRIKLLFKENNEGKGANIKNALNHATGDVVLFQDADLEYSPENFEDLLRPFFENEAEVVFGTRLSRAKTTRITGFPNYIANKIITFLANFLYNKIFSDISTGYKVFKKDIIKNLNITSNGFEIEPEITAKISKMKNLKIFEVPISIFSRNYDEGKKVRWWHFFTYLYHLLKWRIIS
jgi:glycosyltransferase involved in cell wall biosynthesis